MDLSTGFVTILLLGSERVKIEAHHKKELPRKDLRARPPQQKFITSKKKHEAVRLKRNLLLLQDKSGTLILDFQT